jgi:S-formylglutathione hydrolase FrmB
MIWCRDATSNWITELKEGIPPVSRRNNILDLPATNEHSFSSAKVYDPWNDNWTTFTVNDNRIVLPPFTRSLVVILK